MQDKIKIHNPIHKATAKFLGESAATALLKYARRHHGYTRGDVSELDAVEDSLKELFGTGSAVILRSIKIEIAAMFGEEPQLDRPIKLSSFVKQLMNSGAKGTRRTTRISGIPEAHR